MVTLRTEPCPSASTVTTPPPAVPVTVRWASASWAACIWLCICWACSISFEMSMGVG
jgi:hypothetical protein